MSPTSFQLIAALVRRETAMVYDAGKEYLVEARLLPLAVAAGIVMHEWARRRYADGAIV